MAELQRFIKVEFDRFKAFKAFRLNLKHFNILVGPNNAGKSTILTSFRILAAALRRANTKRAVPVRGPNGSVLGHDVDLRSISVAEENIFFNYDTNVPAKVVFHLDNRNTLTLFFPEPGACHLIPEAHGKAASNPANFKKEFNGKYILDVPSLMPYITPISRRIEQCSILRTRFSKTQTKPVNT